MHVAHWRTMMLQQSMATLVVQNAHLGVVPLVLSRRSSMIQGFSDESQSTCAPALHEISLSL